MDISDEEFKKFEDSLSYTKNSVLEWGVNGSIALGIIFGIIIGALINNSFGLVAAIISAIICGTLIAGSGMFSMLMLQEKWYHKWQSSNNNSSNKSTESQDGPRTPGE